MQPMNGNMTRRGVTVLLGSIATVRAQPKGPLTAVHQEVDFKVTPARIYEVLLDAKQFSAFTKDTAEIQRQPGGAFKLFGGRVEGRNIELTPNRRIVQAWRASDWKAGFYTVIRFDLAARGTGAHLTFDQAGFIEDPAEWKGLDEGWPKMYWDPLHKYLG
jgi:activator of HSP90 ATPase